jgi:hypothetical protein
VTSVSVWLVDLVARRASAVSLRSGRMGYRRAARIAIPPVRPDLPPRMRARAILTALVGKTLRRPVRLRRRPKGQPSVHGGRHQIEISISYAPGVAAIAIGRGVRVGVDIETSEAASDLLSIAEVALSDADTRRLRAMPSGRRPAAFLAAWTSLEAILKARGTGFLGTLPQFQLVDARATRPARARHRCWGKCSVEVVRIVGPPGSTAALAILTCAPGMELLR